VVCGLNVLVTDKLLMLCSSGRKQGVTRKAATHQQSLGVRSQGSLQQAVSPAALGHDVVISYDIPLAQDLKDIRYSATVLHAA